MWEIIEKKVQLLKQYDNLYTVFDSSFHKYKFGERKKTSDLLIFETNNNILLPEQLCSFLKYFGDCGAGPDWGMYSLDKFNIYNPHNLHEEDIFNDNVKGFLGIIDRYYSYESCIITSGNHFGKIYSFEENSFFFKTHDSLFDFYLEWLNIELSQFQFILDAIKLNHSINSIIIELFNLKKIQPKITLKKISSLINWKNFRNAINIDKIPDYTTENISDFSLSKNIELEIKAQILLFKSHQNPI